MKIKVISCIIVAGLAMAAMPGKGRAELQAGAGLLLLNDEDLAVGFNGEFGGLYRGSMLDSFFGAQLLLAGGDGDEGGASIESSYFAVMGMYRGYFPLGMSRMFKIYGEGGIGFGSTAVDYTARNGSMDADEFGFAFQLGLGVEYAFTENFALRGGFDFLALPEVSEGFGDRGGGMGSFTIGITLRF
jgi:opacity protein-like surface antigen